MAKFVKVILFLLLTVTLHGVASNVFTEKPVEQSELAITYSMKQHEQISAPDFPYAPVAELNNLQSHQISVTRIQRVQLGEYFTTLRNLLQWHNHRLRRTFPMGDGCIGGARADTLSDFAEILRAGHRDSGKCTDFRKCAILSGCRVTAGGCRQYRKNDTIRAEPHCG